MKNRFKNFVLAMAVLSFSTSAFAAELKVATVDMRKVFESYHKTAEATMAITNLANELKKGVAEMVSEENQAQEAGKAAYDRAHDMSISAEEREKSKKVSEDKAQEIQSLKSSIERYESKGREDLETKRSERIGAIVKEIREVLNAMAARGGYDLVLDKSGETSPGVPVVIYSSATNDLSEAMIKELNAGALPIPPAENKKTSASDTKPAPK